MTADKINSDIPETVPTVGLNGKTCSVILIIIINGRSIVSKCDLKGVQCQFWDLGGGGDLPKLWPKYYAEAHAVFFVIDSLEINDRLLATLSKSIVSIIS